MAVVISASGRVIVDYMAEIFDEATIQRMLASLALVLASLAAAPDSRVGTACFQPPADLARIMADLAPGEQKLGHLQEPLVHAAVRQHGERDPDRPCLIYEGATLSYGEVNARANQLARALTRLGVGRNVVVGIMVDRSFDLMIATLAAWKAGGVFLPLDPEYPDERLAMYAEDAHAAVLVTTAEHVARAAQLVAGMSPEKVRVERRATAAAAGGVWAARKGGQGLSGCAALPARREEG